MSKSAAILYLHHPSCAPHQYVHLVATYVHRCTRVRTSRMATHSAKPPEPKRGFARDTLAHTPTHYCVPPVSSTCEALVFRRRPGVSGIPRTSGCWQGNANFSLVGNLTKPIDWVDNA